MVHQHRQRPHGRQWKHGILIAVGLLAEYIGETQRLDGSVEVDRDALPDRILRRSLHLGPSVGVLRPSHGFLQHFCLLLRFHFPLCFYTQYRSSSRRSVSLRDLYQRRSGEHSGNLRRLMGSD